MMTFMQANFTESQEKIVRLLRAVWMRKRIEREKREWDARLTQLHKRLKEHLH